jgi:hypothetical protein
MEDCRRQACWTLMQTVLKEEFPQFLEALQGQDFEQQHHGKVAPIEFKDTGTSSIKRTDNSTELCAHFRSQGENCPATNLSVIRHLYILEDFGRADIEALGSYLGVPPSFFAAHWCLPKDRVATVDPAILTHDGRAYFKLLYPELYMIDQATGDAGFPVGLYQDVESNAPRIIDILDRESQVKSSKHHISFWSANGSTESWKCKSRYKHLVLQILTVAWLSYWWILQCQRYNW